MEERMRQIVNETAAEVFSTMFFAPIELFPTLPEPGQWPVGAPAIKAGIAYHGKLSGRVWLYFSLSLAASITSSFLAVAEEELSDQLLLDTMKEAANMLVGGVLGKLDPEGASTLGIPEATTVADFSVAMIAKEPGLQAFSTEIGFLWMTYAEGQ